MYYDRKNTYLINKVEKVKVTLGFFCVENLAFILLVENIKQKVI